MDEREFDMIKLWRTLWGWRYVIIISFFGPAIIAMIVSLLWPKSYTAEIHVLSPYHEDGAGLGGTFSLGLASTKGEGVSPQAVVALLNSSNMISDVVREFDLQNKFGTRTRSDAAKKIRELTTINFSETKPTIVLEVTTRWPEISADIANFYIKNLKNLNEEVNLTSKTPVVKVIDWASPPKRKSRPKIKMNMAISGALGIIFCLFFIYVRTIYENNRDEDRNQY